MGIVCFNSGQYLLLNRLSRRYIIGPFFQLNIMTSPHKKDAYELCGHHKKYIIFLSTNELRLVAFYLVI